MKETISLSRDFEEFINKYPEKDRKNLISTISHIGFHYLRNNYLMRDKSINYYQKILDDLKSQTANYGSDRINKNSPNRNETFKQSEENFKYDKTKNSDKKNFNKDTKSLKNCKNEFTSSPFYMLQTNLSEHPIFPYFNEKNGQIDKIATNVGSSNRINSSELGGSHKNLKYSEISSYDRLKSLLSNKDKYDSNSKIANHDKKNLNNENDIEKDKSRINGIHKPKEFRKRARDDSLSDNDKLKYKKSDTDDKNYNSRSQKSKHENVKEKPCKKPKKEDDNFTPREKKEFDSKNKIQEEKTKRPNNSEKIITSNQRKVQNSNDIIINEEKRKNLDNHVDSNKLISQENKNITLKKTESTETISNISEVNNFESNEIFFTADAIDNNATSINYSLDLKQFFNLNSFKNFKNFKFIQNRFSSFYIESFKDPQLKNHLLAHPSLRLRFLKIFPDYKKLASDKKLNNIINGQVQKVLGVIKTYNYDNSPITNIFHIELEKENQVQKVFVTENILKKKLNTKEIRVQFNKD